jgi:hypothetical protein
MNSAVVPSVSGWSEAAPAASISCTNSAWPHSAATMSGVVPSGRAWLGSGGVTLESRARPTLQ